MHFASGGECVRSTGLAIPLSTIKKLDKKYETTVFRHWIQAVQVCDSPEKGNKQDDLCFSWLSWNSDKMLVGM